MNTFLNFLATLNFFLVFIYTSLGLVYFALLSLLSYAFGKYGEGLRHYATRNMVAPDQWWNAALRGEEDETVSSRLGRAILSGKMKWWAKVFASFVNGLFKLIAGQDNHCLESIEERYLDEGAPSDERLSFIKEDKAA